MPIIAKYTGQEFTPAPEGLHQAICVDVIDMGLQDTPWGSKHKVQIRWQLEDVEEKTQTRFLVLSQYTLSLNEKANLCKQLESWRGRKFTPEELEGFDLEKLIGANCQLQIIHNMADNGRTYANVQAIVPLGKGMEKIEPENYIRMKDRRDDNSGYHNESGDPDDDMPF